MDGLSVAASLTGLLQVSAKIIGFISTMKDAPSLAQNVHSEVVALEAIFRQLHGYMTKTKRGSKLKMMHVGHVIVTLTGCVCAFDQLERELGDLNPSKRGPGIIALGLDVWDRARWAQKDPAIRRILEDLRRLKSSLNIMVSLNSSQSTQEAEHKIDRLTAMVDILLQSNPNLAERIFNYDEIFQQEYSDAASKKSTNTARSSGFSILKPTFEKFLQKSQVDTKNDENYQHTQDSDSISIRSTNTIRSLRASISFETDLRKCQVYINANRNASTNTFKSFTSSESRWSKLSGLTLSQITNILIVCLPVTIDELVDTVAWNTLSNRKTSKTVKVSLRKRIGFLAKQIWAPINLYLAAERGNTIAVRIFLDQGTDVNAQGEEHGNALQAAARYGHQDTVRFLLVNGVDANAQGGFYGNAVQAAVVKNNWDIVRLLIKNGADPNARGGEYENALQAAACYGYQNIVRILLENGANINAQGGEYGNALQAAAYYGHQDTVRLLFENSADPNAQGGFYGNALQAARSARYSQSRARREIIGLLLDNGAHN